MMKLLEQWRHYMGPADERIERETNRIYKYGFYLLAIGSLATLYYAGALEQVAYVNNLTLETEAMSTVVPVEWLLLASLLVSACTCAVLMYRKGFVSGGRFAEADTFPTDYFAACSALAAFAISLGVVALRIAAEVQLVGIGGIMWVGDIAIGVVYFIQFAMLIYLMCYGSFVVAKRYRDKLNAQLDD